MHPTSSPGKVCLFGAFLHLFVADAGRQASRHRAAIRDVGPRGRTQDQRSFLRNLSREAASRGIAVPSRARIIVAARALEADPAPPASDAVSRQHIAVASLVLAAYRELQADIPESDIRVEMLKRALLQAYRAQLRRPYRLVLAVSRDCFHTLTRMLASAWVERKLFGSGFHFRRQDAGGTFDLVIDRCIYHRFFAASDAPELTPVICHSDHAWIDELDPLTHGVRFSRATTLGWDDAECVFRFEREAANNETRNGASSTPPE